MSMRRVLRVENLKKYFGGIKAVDNVTFFINDGEILGLIGPNGSGKTTVINLITGFRKPDSGRIIYKGKDITGKPPHVVAQMGIIRTFQLTRPFKSLTVLSNVTLGALLKEKNLEYARTKALKILKMLNMDEKKDVLCENLSVPDQRKVELARALAADPEVVLLDEVLAGLTLEEANHILEELKELNKKGLTMLIVEHRVRLISRIVNRLIVLNEGKVVAEGSPQEVLKNPIVIKIYLGEG